MALKTITHDPARDQAMRITDGGQAQRVSYTWFRGETCAFGPTEAHLAHWEGYRDYFIGRLAPPEPLIGPQTRITAFGSCFAANISAWLARRRYTVMNRSESSTAYIVRSGEGFVNSYSILQQFQWAFEGIQPSVSLWHGYDAKAFGYDEAVRADTRAIFDQTDLFILTFGLSEVWYDKPTGEVFWRAVPAESHDPERHGFRTVSVEENEANIRATIALIRKHRPDANIVITLSPIPLVATFRDVPCPTANAVSKGSLRMAIDRIMQAGVGDGRVFYWPSYEIVLDGFQAKWEADLRHVKRPVLDFIMRLFEQHWCQGGLPDADLSMALVRAKVADGSIRKRTVKALAEAAGTSAAEPLLAGLEANPRVLPGYARSLRAAFGGPVSPET